jgi:putative endonuclease
MFFVYLLRSKESPENCYVGVTNDVEIRLAEHNAGESIHTNKFRPWELVGYVAFVTLDKAKAFEAYLKCGTGRSFCRKFFSVFPPEPMRKRPLKGVETVKGGRSHAEAHVVNGESGFFRLEELKEIIVA